MFFLVCCIRYSPVAIKFAISLKAKLGTKHYEALRRVFIMPSKRHLINFRLGSADDPGGMLHGVLGAMRSKGMAKQNTPWQFRGALSFDGMKIRESLYWSINSETVVGFGSDVFENPDAIAREFQRHARTAAASTDVQSLPLAKDYLVFYFSCLDPKTPYRFPVARYSVTTVAPRFLISTIPVVLHELSNYGFVAVSVTSDGAGENRAAMASLADIPASFFLGSVLGKKLDIVDENGSHREVAVVRVIQGRQVAVRAVPGVALHPTQSPLPGPPEEVVDLDAQSHVWRDRPQSLQSDLGVVGAQAFDFFHPGPLPATIDLSKNVAFVHPSLPGVYVMVNQDMPHVVKRFVNALEASSPHDKRKRNIYKFNRGVKEYLNLEMIRRAWESLGGGRQQQVRTDDLMKITLSHFKKDCWSRMRVPLAVQVFSQRSARLQKRASNGEREAGCQPLIDSERGAYGSLIELTVRLDRIVDIMNARGERGAPILSSPHHPLIVEALDILEWFCVWEKDLRERGEDMDEAFFAKELFEDANGLLIGLACTARFNLAFYAGAAIVQRFLDQDPCEHHFNHLRQAGGATRAVTAYSSANSTVIAGGLHVGGLAVTGNCAGTVTMEEANTPLPRRPSHS